MVHCYALLNFNLREPLGDRAFSSAAPALWNSLPSAIRNVDQSIESLKRKRKTLEFLPSNNQKQFFVHICNYISFYLYLFEYHFIALLLLLFFYF